MNYNESDDVHNSGNASQSEEESTISSIVTSARFSLDGPLRISCSLFWSKETHMKLIAFHHQNLNPKLKNVAIKKKAGMSIDV